MKNNEKVLENKFEILLGSLYLLMMNNKKLIQILEIIMNKK